MKQVTDKTIKDTGERMVPAYHRGHLVYGEHIVRYQAAAELVKGKVVLDIASGSGYGSACLAEAAKHVYGVDIDADAISYAKKNYGSKNVEFIKGDGVSIPLDDNSVEMVVTFETIEHIEDYKTFMSEIRRVLKDDGLLVLSTPNDVEFPESNHFHIHEFERDELDQLIKKYFKNTKWYFEGTWLYDALLSQDQITETWDKDIYTLQTAPVDLQKSLSFFVLCSNRAITESVSPRAAIAEHYSERTRQEYEQSVRKHMDDQAAIISHQQNEINHRTHDLEVATAELKVALEKLDHIKRLLPVKLYSKAAKIKKDLTGKK
jgi:ubiquinone/menaquinone biosynthesis C-methylase UbiE